MIQIEIKDINGKSVSIGDKIIFYYDDEPEDDIYVVELKKTSDSVYPAAFKENRNEAEIRAGAHRTLGGTYSYDFKIIS